MECGQLVALLHAAFSKRLVHTNNAPTGYQFDLAGFVRHSHRSMFGFPAVSSFFSMPLPRHSRKEGSIMAGRVKPGASAHERQRGLRLRWCLLSVAHVYRLRWWDGVSLLGRVCVPGVCKRWHRSVAPVWGRGGCLCLRASVEPCWERVLKK